MTYQWDFLRQLAKNLDDKNTSAALEVLHNQAQHLLDIAAKREHNTAGAAWLEDRARWLIHAAFALPEIQKIEAGIENERRQIETLESRILKSVRAFKDGIENICAVARRMSELGMDDHHCYPTAPNSVDTYYRFQSPVSYLEKILRKRYLHGFSHGKPKFYSAIEDEPYDSALIALIAMDPHWENYFNNCIGYFRAQFMKAQVTLPVHKLFELSKYAAECKAHNFDAEIYKNSIAKIRDLYTNRQEIMSSIYESTSKIDYFYESLACCEANLFVTPLSLPSSFRDYLGQPPIGMPYYPQHHPNNRLHGFDSGAKRY